MSIDTKLPQRIPTNSTVISQHLLIATSIHLSLLDVRNGQRVEHSQYSMLSRLSWDLHSRRDRGVSGRLRTHRGKIFMLVSQGFGLPDISARSFELSLDLRRPRQISEPDLSCYGQIAYSLCATLEISCQQYILRWLITLAPPPGISSVYQLTCQPENRS